MRDRAAERERRRNDFSFERLSDSLFDYGLIFLVAALSAIGVSIAMRAAGLRWTWSLIVLPVLAPLAFVSSHAAVGVLVLIGVSGGVGYARERQDLERGGTEAQVARERRGPWTKLVSVALTWRWRRERVRGGRFGLGVSARGTVFTVPFGLGQGTRAFIVGAPGSGKTITLAAHAHAYALAGFPVIAIDPKGDLGLRDLLESLARELGRRFIEWTPDGPSTYNPLARGSASEIADKALAGEEWSEPHYLRQAQRYLGLEVKALEDARIWPPTLRALAEYLDPARLDSLADGLEGEQALRLRAYLDSLSQRSRQELSGVRDRIAVLSESGLGRWLEPVTGAAEIELESAIAEGAIVYFQLDSDRFPLASQMLGASIVVDLVSLSGQLQGAPLRGLVMVDEFAAVAAEEISRLLSRSRSAGLSVLVATQAFADLSLARMGDSTESLRRQVLSHVDYLVAHRQSEPEAAELLGQMAGTKPAWAVARKEGKGEYVWQSGDQITRRRTREFVRHPDEFKSLGIGEAIVIEPASKQRAERIRIWPPR